MKNFCEEIRITYLNKKNKKNGTAVYWMTRDYRVSDNWALIYAQYLAVKEDRHLVVFCSLFPFFKGKTIRQYDFLIKGLQEVEKRLEKLNIPFYITNNKEPANFFKEVKAGVIVTDFDALREKRKEKKKIIQDTNCAVIEVDAHNIVPCREASVKQEYSARTIRPKIRKILPDFLIDFPKIKKQKKFYHKVKNKIKWDDLIKGLDVDMSVGIVKEIIPGEKEAKRKLKRFIENRLKDYDEKRNNPSLHGQSGLSPYIHFGQISSQRIALEIKKSNVDARNKEAFLEELIIRKELSDNFCFYNKYYDSIRGFPNWGRETLLRHKSDKREYIYTERELENGKTHDDLWNYAQLEMVKSGKMHGYMRMYWAKKILQWSKTPNKALKTAIKLNDKYELDGNDPKGYNGIAWSIGGVHDRAWSERPIFGKIRYMSYNGSKSKFNIKKYIDKIIEIEV